MEPHRILATSSTHQACGPIRFGMRGAELQRASTQLRAAGQGKFTAAILRQWLVTNGVKHPARLADRDHAIRLDMRCAVGRPLYELTFQSHEYYPAAEYESVVKPVWETLQDVADSKFARTTKRGEFPPFVSIQKLGKIFVSDTWEVDNIRVEVGILAGTFYGDPTLKYTAVLKVTDLAALPSAQ
jgi:hypothetical protein